MTLKERLSQTPEQQSAAALERKLEQAKLQAANDLSESRYQLSLAKEQLEAAYLSAPFSLQTVISAKAVVKELELGLKMGEEIMAECFGK